MFETGLEIFERPIDVLHVPGHVLAGRLVVAELLGAVALEVDLVGEPGVDGGEGAIDVIDPAGAHLLEMLGDERPGSERHGSRFKIGAQPVFRENIADLSAVGLGDRLEIKVRCPAGKGRRAVGLHADKLHPLGEDDAVAPLHLMGEQEEQ